MTKEDLDNAIYLYESALNFGRIADTCKAIRESVQDGELVVTSTGRRTDISGFGMHPDLKPHFERMVLAGLKNFEDFARQMAADNMAEFLTL